MLLHLIIYNNIFYVLSVFSVTYKAKTYVSRVVRSIGVQIS